MTAQNEPAGNTGTWQDLKFTPGKICSSLVRLLTILNLFFEHVHLTTMGLFQCSLFHIPSHPISI